MVQSAAADKVFHAMWNLHRLRVAGLHLPPQLGNVRVHGAAEDIGAGVVGLIKTGQAAFLGTRPLGVTADGFGSGVT